MDLEWIDCINESEVEFMDKKNWIFLGKECIYMIIIAVLMCVSSYVQLIGLVEKGYATGFFGGTIYGYNPLFYALGDILLVAVSIVAYKYILSKEMSKLREYKFLTLILYFVICLGFTFAGFVGIVMVYLLSFGLGGGVDSDILNLISWFGWPVTIIVCMIIMFVFNIKNKSQSVGE